MYIIAGPNGSGKTTFAKEFLPNYAHCPHFVNADLIAQGLSPFSPQQVAIKAGKLVLDQIKEMVKRKIDFGFETTLAGKTYLRHFQNLKEEGYQLHLFFLWLPDPQLAVARIKNRVAEGGHDVPVVDIKRRFGRSIHNFFHVYIKMSDSWILFDNSGIKPKVIAKMEHNKICKKDMPLLKKIINKTGVEI